MQHANQAMDEVRRLEREGNEMIKKHKYTFLKDQSRLFKSKKGALDHLLMTYPVLGESYRLKEMFRDTFNIEDSEEAKSYLQF